MKKVIPIFLVIAIGLCGCNVFSKNETVNETSVGNIGQMRDASFDGTRMKGGKYTQEYLRFVFEFIEKLSTDNYGENMPQTDSQGDVKWTSIGIAENCVEVGLIDLTEDNMALFRENVFDSDVLKFILGPSSINLLNE